MPNKNLTTTLFLKTLPLILTLTIGGTTVAKLLGSNNINNTLGFVSEVSQRTGIDLTTLSVDELKELFSSDDFLEMLFPETCVGLNDNAGFTFNIGGKDGLSWNLTSSSGVITVNEFSDGVLQYDAIHRPVGDLKWVNAATLGSVVRNDLDFPEIFIQNGTQYTISFSCSNGFAADDSLGFYELYNYYFSISDANSDNVVILDCFTDISGNLNIKTFRAYNSNQDGQYIHIEPRNGIEMYPDGFNINEYLPLFVETLIQGLHTDGAIEFSDELTSTDN